MPQSERNGLRITDPLIELLAIKLYEHDDHGTWPPQGVTVSWIALDNEDREIYRSIARGG